MKETRFLFANPKVSTYRNEKRKLARILDLVCILLITAVSGQLTENAHGTQASNESSGLDEFGMVVKTNGVQSFKDEDFVVKKGIISESWRPSCRDSPKTTDGDKLCTPQTFDEYYDQLTLEFLYNDPSLYTFKRPTLKVNGGRAQPHIRDFANDLDEKSGEITIRHGCTLVSQGKVVSSIITLKLQITPRDSITLSWTKKCGFGEHGKIDYGWFTINSDGDTDKPKTLRNAKSLPTFGPRSLSTRVFLTLINGAHSQYYDTPVVTSQTESAATNNEVGIALRGSNFGGVVLSSSFVVFDVMYNCVGKGTSTVTATIGIAPFNAIRMKWRKDCGGGTATRIQVCVQPPGWKGRFAMGNVVQNGTAVGAYGAASTGKYASTALVGATRSSTRRFYIWAKWSDEDDVDGQSGEEIGEISAHSENERIAVAGVSGRSGKLIAPGLGEHGGALKSAKVIRIWTRCVRRGKVRVRVTVTVRDRLPVEWWFDDACSRKRLTTVGSGITAVEVMRLSMGMFAIAMAVWMWKGISGGRKADRMAVIRREWRSV